MIWILFGILLLAVLFGGPALMAGARHQLARRKAAAEARATAEEERERADRAAKEEIELLWRNSPDRAGVGEHLKYIAAKMSLTHAAAEAARELERRAEQVTRYLSRFPGGRSPSVRYRLVVMTGFAFFLGAFALAITLDFLIFRGLHPTGSVVLPFGLACLAVMGITVGSVIMFGVKRHDLLPGDISDYYRRVIIVGGALLAVCVAGYMAMIAPNRSYPAGQAAINKAQQVLQADKTAIPPVSPQVINLDQTAVTQARTSLAHAEQVDRLSAGALAFIEIPLSEAAVLGGELLYLYLAISRREQARRTHRRALATVEQADAKFVAELTRVLISHGHNEESVGRIVERVKAMNLPAAPRPGPAPAIPPPAVTVVPHAGPVPGGPTAVVPPHPPGGPAVATEMAAIVTLPAEDEDQTE